MNKEFQKDYYRMTGTMFSYEPHSIIRFLFSHQIKYMRLWRRAKNKPTVINRYRVKYYGKKYGLEISLDANIGEGFYLGHAFNITVGNGVVIGNNVNLHKGCTIGRENRGDRDGVPNIGSNVYVGINSTIVGNVMIGNDVLIAPNSFVNFDVPSHSVVIGNPATVHQKEEATAGYIAFKVGREEQ